MSNIFEELTQRGYTEQLTHPEEIKNLLDNESISFYIGFDPTADSLHVGHFISLMVASHMQKAGHRPIILIGGGTATIGDPSGKTDMRRMMSREEIDHNVECFKKQIAKFLSFEGENAAIIVNNADWLLDLKFINFAREIGSLFSVNKMLAAECYKQKIEFFNDSVAITVRESNDEQLNNLVTKINEKYETSLTKDDLTVVEIPHYRGRDLIANYVWPIAISAALIIVYEAIRFRKLGVVKVVAKLIIWPIVIEALYLSVLAITRIPISYYTLPLGIILAVLTLTIITYKNEKKLVEYNRKKNKNSEDDND